MSTLDGLVDIDANGNPIYGDSPFKVSKDVSFTTNGTVVKSLFTLTGTVMVTRIWGEVLTDLGSNHTAASFSLVETAGSTVYLTSVGGTTLSSIKAGSMIIKDGLVAAAVTKIDNVAGAILEPAVVNQISFTPVIITKKTAVVTTVSYRYITNNTSLGSMRFYVAYYPLSSDGRLVAV